MLSHYHQASEMHNDQNQHTLNVLVYTDVFLFRYSEVLFSSNIKNNKSINFNKRILLTYLWVEYDCV